MCLVAMPCHFIIIIIIILSKIYCILDKKSIIYRLKDAEAVDNQAKVQKG